MSRKVAAAPVEREDLRAGADGHDEHRLRPIDEEAAGELVDARLQERRRIVVVLQRRQHRENHADRGVGIDIRRPVERIDGDEQRGFLVEQQRRVHLLRGDRRHRRASQHVDDAVVGENVDLLLLVDLAQLAGRAAERTRPARPAPRDRPSRSLPSASASIVAATARRAGRAAAQPGKIGG